MDTGTLKITGRAFEKLFDGPAALVEFRDAFNRACALMTRFNNPSRWDFASVGTSGWSSALRDAGMEASEGSVTRGQPGRVIVYSPAGLPVVNTVRATLLAFYINDVLQAAVNRQFDDDIWSLSRDCDEDWQAALVRLGLRENPTVLT